MESNNSPISGSPENTDSGSPIPISTKLHSVPLATIPANGGLTTGEPNSRNLVGSSKRKRGRPRKYDTLRNLHPSYTSSNRISSPPSRAVSLPPGFALTPSFVFDSPRRARGRASGTSSQINWNNQPYFQPLVLGGGIPNTERMHITFQVIMLNAGEDIAAKLFLIGVAGPDQFQFTMLLVKSQVLLFADLAGGVIGYEGRYHLLSLTGSYKTNEVNGVTTTTGSISVSLVGPDGIVFGGMVAGLLIAATPIQLSIGTFIPQTATAIPASPDAMPAEIPNLHPVSVGNGVGASVVPPMPVQTQDEEDDDIIELEVWGNESQPAPQGKMYPDINVTVPDDE